MILLNLESGPAETLNLELLSRGVEAPIPVRGVPRGVSAVRGQTVPLAKGGEARRWHRALSYAATFSRCRTVRVRNRSLFHGRGPAEQST